jgi:hypothetical protein
MLVVVAVVGAIGGGGEAKEAGRVDSAISYFFPVFFLK